jgi:hypothetical protein
MASAVRSEDAAAASTTVSVVESSGVTGRSGRSEEDIRR